VAAVPAEDATFRRWKAIIADESRVPAGTPLAALVPKLVAYLGSPDPVRRDGRLRGPRSLDPHAGARGGRRALHVQRIAEILQGARA
jgi:hypothetical protein